MTDEARLEYHIALYGHPPPVVTADSDGLTIDELIEHNEALEDRETAGCYGEASRSVYPDEAFFEEFGDLLEAAAERATADPRYVEAEERWSRCMAERGYDFASHQELFLYVYGPELDGMSGELQERVEEIFYGPGNQFGAPSGHEADFEGEGVGDDDLGWDSSEEGVVPELDMAKLQALIDEEVSMAVADWECSEGLRRVWVELAEAAERDFIDENRDRLLEFRKRGRRSGASPADLTSAGARGR